jgi:hypothetical protein
MTDRERIEAITPKNNLEIKVKEFLLEAFEKQENQIWLKDADKEANDDLLSFIEVYYDLELVSNDELIEGTHKLRGTNLTYNQVIDFMNDYNLMP